MIGEKAFKDNILPEQYSKIKLLNLSTEKKMEQVLNIMTYVARIFDKKFSLTNLCLKITSINPD